LRVYLDASVVLRLVLRERGPSVNLGTLAGGVCSELTRVECLRTLDRLRLLGRLDEGEVARARTAAFEILNTSGLIPLTPAILARASDPFPAPLGTLDAIHLATALTFRDVTGEELVFATHDEGLAEAARSMNFDVVGL